MRTRTRKLAALALVGAGLLAGCANGYADGSSAPDATGVGPSTTAKPPVSAAPAPASDNAGSSVARAARTDLGNVLVDANGMTMYAFTNDTNGASTCTGACAKTWPAVIVPANFSADASAKAANLHTLQREDGTLQLAAGKWPLYTFSGDSQPGDVNGQGSGGKWFVVQPDGALHKTSSAAPAAQVAPSAPASNSLTPSTPSTAPSTTKAPARPSGY